MRAPTAAGDPVRAQAPAVHARAHRHTALPINDDAVPVALAAVPLPADHPGSGIAGSDWDDLFNAVKYRLIHIVSESGLGPMPVSTVGIAQVRDRVLECVSALELLQLSVTAERLRHDGLETAVREAQASLAQVRAALVGTQPGERRVRHHASHDSLTQLPNPGFLLDSTDLAMVAAKRQHDRNAFFSRDDAAVAPARRSAATDGNPTTANLGCPGMAGRQREGVLHFHAQGGGH